MLIKIAQFLFAFRFLTILPLSGTDGLFDRLTEKDMGRSSIFFPLIGLLKGGIFYLLYHMTVGIFSYQISVLMIVIASIVITGGLHLDGVADTVDALASRKKGDEKLKIMKEGTVGAIGVVAIVMVLLSKYILLKEIVKSSSIYICLFPVIGAISMNLSMSIGKSARSDGLGRMFIEASDKRMLFVSTIIFFLICFLMVVFAGLNLRIVLLSTGIVCLSLLYFDRLFRRHFNGLTGDNLGFVSEISELLFLLCLIPFLS